MESSKDFVRTIAYGIEGQYYKSFTIVQSIPTIFYGTQNVIVGSVYLITMFLQAFEVNCLKDPFADKRGRCCLGGVP